MFPLNQVLPPLRDFFHPTPSLKHNGLSSPKQLSEDSLVPHFPTFCLEKCDRNKIFPVCLNGFLHLSIKKGQLKDFYVEPCTVSYWQHSPIRWGQTTSVTSSSERTQCTSLPLGKCHLIYKLVAGSSPKRPQRTLIETAIYSYALLIRSPGQRDAQRNSDRASLSADQQVWTDTSVWKWYDDRYQVSPTLWNLA